MSTTKPFSISKHMVWEAYLRVKSNKGSAGVDNQSIAEFEVELKANLYRIWNRMSSGSYFPPPIRAVSIPKKSGCIRKRRGLCIARMLTGQSNMSPLSLIFWDIHSSPEGQSIVMVLCSRASPLPPVGSR